VRWAKSRPYESTCGDSTAQGALNLTWQDNLANFNMDGGGDHWQGWLDKYLLKESNVTIKTEEQDR
jgi:hypothetical protein